MIICFAMDATTVGQGKNSITYDYDFDLTLIDGFLNLK